MLLDLPKANSHGVKNFSDMFALGRFMTYN